MPDGDADGQFGEAAREEICRAEGRRAHVEYQPFAAHAQVLPLIGQQSAFREFDAGHLQARDLARLQLPLDGLVKLVGGGHEPRDERIPMAQNVGFGRLEEAKHRIMRGFNPKEKDRQWRK